MAFSLSSQKNLTFYSFPILFFLFLLSVFFFSKQALEPSTSLYRDLSVESPLLDKIPDSFFRFTESPEQVAVHALSPSDIDEISLGQSISPVASPVNDLEVSVTSGDGDGSDKETSKYFPLEKEEKKWDKECDLYSGSWVKDDAYPLYKPGSCPYVDEAFSCQGNGRSDEEYTKWRWKPRGCETPRFNATDFLERLRGKKLMLVGDSMNRNQFESLLCLLWEALPNKSRMYETRGFKISKGRGYFIFKFEDYNCTVSFCRSHFLAREGIRVKPDGSTMPTLTIDRIDKSANRWKHADILVFNTGHWWTHGKTARGKDYYQEGNVIYPKFDAIEAFRRAMRTWGKWIKANAAPAKKLVFYRGYSSAHFRGGDWDSGGTCNGEKEPIVTGAEAFIDTYPLKMRIIEEVIRELKVPAILLNVTKLTNYRKDGHPSIYGKIPTKGRKVSSRKQDCSHWCLPGVPDAWNELIYASLVMGQAPSWNKK